MFKINTALAFCIRNQVSMAINEDIRGLGARVRLKNDRRKNNSRGRWEKP